VPDAGNCHLTVNGLPPAAESLPASLPECHVPSWVCRSTSRARSQELSALSRHVKPTLATAC
jgi:hypothetical protein